METLLGSQNYTIMIINQMSVGTDFEIPKKSKIYVFNNNPLNYSENGQSKNVRMAAYRLSRQKRNIP